MLYVICNPKKEHIGLDNNKERISVTRKDISILKIDRNILIENEVKFSNSNCACNIVELYNNVRHLDKLNWHDITTKELPYNVLWSYQQIRDEQKIFRHNKAAEIIALNNVPTKFINSIVVNNLDYASSLYSVLEDNPIVIEDRTEFEW